MTIEEIEAIGLESLEDLLFGTEGKEIYIPHMKERSSERGVGQINFKNLEVFVRNVHNARIKDNKGDWFDEDACNYCCELIINSDGLIHKVKTNDVIKRIIRSQRRVMNITNLIEENKFNDSYIKVYLSKERYNWRMAFYLIYEKENKKYLICSVVTQETFLEIFEKSRQKLNNLSKEGLKIFKKYLREQKKENESKKLSTEELFWFINL